ncbi:CYTH domain-containing protein [Paucibacter sp. R3-3]|uniref:CYTH domain-containing protein n=1 Tax=Roseateles agri TaxID=3098619 RepID=A0ABU5DIP1_9BURK|nr:CYTH domain-containing protein [Paucibacter sp. R3-3]MDY0746165.1 CYTH domain-containing protein [Paucibacter sp. R3-3]
MGIEIERKFLVVGEAWKQGLTPERLSQGYLNRDKQRTVRVRLAGGAAWLTIKGESRGATRAEFEYPIPVEDAEQLLALCDGPRVEKYRWRVPHGGLVWEVDEFLGDNAGLVVAEVELAAEDQAFDMPSWAGEDVTADPRYFNSSLASRPFKDW